MKITIEVEAATLDGEWGDVSLEMETNKDDEDYIYIRIPPISGDILVVKTDKLKRALECLRSET